jgi:hypothetical protein
MHVITFSSTSGPGVFTTSLVCGPWCNCPCHVRSGRADDFTFERARERERVRRNIDLLFGSNRDELEAIERDRVLQRLFARWAYADMVRDRARHLVAPRCPAARLRAAPVPKLRRTARGQPLGLRNFARR